MDSLSECAICSEEFPILYQCCSNKKDSLCELCWCQMISMVIQKGKISLLFNRELLCEFCREPIERDHLPLKIQDQLKNILLTIPKTKKPKTIEGFNYSYNNSNALRHCLTN